MCYSSVGTICHRGFSFFFFLLLPYLFLARSPITFYFRNCSRLERDIIKILFQMSFKFALRCHLVTKKLICSTSPSSPVTFPLLSSYPFFLFVLFICVSLRVFLQWTAILGPRWSPCIQPSWSASHVPPRKWARLWRRPWAPLKTLCSRLCPESKMESPDWAGAELCFYQYN